jgi:hypothetical protein
MARIAKRGMIRIRLYHQLIAAHRRWDGEA